MYSALLLVNGMRQWLDENSCFCFGIFEVDRILLDPFNDEMVRRILRLTFEIRRVALSMLRTQQYCREERLLSVRSLTHFQQL
jgi:hypothetical protein